MTARASDGPSTGASDGPETGASGGPETGVEADPTLTVRLVMPDRWLEHVEELPADTTVEEAKAIGLRKLLLRHTDRPDDFYVEYAERQVPDETVTLEELGVQPREILSIRAYDLGHYPRFEG
ncbi:MAG: hypothetical protein ACOC7L_04385 [Acidobacteriota bacterium]